jgi:hypothetical protein
MLDNHGIQGVTQGTIISDSINGHLMNGIGGIDSRANSLRSQSEVDETITILNAKFLNERVMKGFRIVVKSFTLSNWVFLMATSTTSPYKLNKPLKVASVIKAST